MMFTALLSGAKVMVGRSSIWEVDGDALVVKNSNEGGMKGSGLSIAGTDKP